MNAKKAKALRKVLRNMVANHHEAIPAHDFMVVPKTDKSVMIETTDENGVVNGVEKKTFFDGQVRVSPRSERAVYLHLKKEMKKA